MGFEVESVPPRRASDRALGDERKILGLGECIDRRRAFLLRTVGDAIYAPGRSLVVHGLPEAPQFRVVQTLVTVVDVHAAPGLTVVVWQVIWYVVWRIRIII